MGKHKYFDTDNQPYRTGQTKPSKSYGGLLAVLLILVIFLSGIISILSVMNIELLRLVKDNNAENIPMLDQTPRHTPHTAQPQSDNSQWGMTCYGVTDFHARYYDLPRGIYISHMESNCSLAKQGIQAGDIITHLNDTAVSDTRMLTQLIQALPCGEKAVFTLIRNQTPVTVTITLNEEFYGTDLS